jgi:hypothetical protein
VHRAPGQSATAISRKQTRHGFRFWSHLLISTETRDNPTRLSFEDGSRHLDNRHFRFVRLLLCRIIPNTSDYFQAYLER